MPLEKIEKQVIKIFKEDDHNKIDKQMLNIDIIKESNK